MYYTGEEVIGLSFLTTTGELLNIGYRPRINGVSTKIFQFDAQFPLIGFYGTTSQAGALTSIGYVAFWAFGCDSGVNPSLIVEEPVTTETVEGAPTWVIVVSVTVACLFLIVAIVLIAVWIKNRNSKQAAALRNAHHDPEELFQRTSEVKSDMIRLEETLKLQLIKFM